MMKDSCLARFIADIRKTLRLWHRRATTRQGLHHLSPHLRADIGLDSVTCAKEARRWFWQGEDAEAKLETRDRNAQPVENPSVSARTAVRGPSS
jgi:uncharacterized protein YjiS (DUF1127 family)